MEDLRYLVNCKYVDRSQATGCFFTLISESIDTDNISGRVDRSTDKGAEVTIVNIANYKRVLAYEWGFKDVAPIVQSICRVENCDRGQL